MQDQPLRIVGAPGSPYSRKLRAVLRYRRIPHRWVISGAPESAGLPQPRVQLLPQLVERGEGGALEARTDSTPLIRELEKRHPGRETIPGDPVVAFLDALLEDYGDEWLTKAMFHRPRQRRRRAAHDRGHALRERRGGRDRPRGAPRTLRRGPITVLRAEGWDSLRERVAGAPAATRVSVSATDLGLPVDLGDHHIAAGTNYPEHAGEAEVEEGPFLFAKLVEPSGPRATVPAGDALLDYEVELAFVTLEPLAEGDVPETMGLVVANDYTDRATLLRHVDVWDPASGKGFTTGKSRPGYLPVGDLLVVPRDLARVRRPARAAPLGRR